MAVMRPPLSELSGGPKVQDLLAENHLEVTPLAYMRGRSLQRVFFIVDEAQNLNPHEIKTIITRAGEGTNWTAPVSAETERFCNPKRERGIVPNSFPRLRFGLLFRKKWRCPTKIVFTGDIQQIDHPYLDSLSNGLSYLIDRMVGQTLFAHVTLEKGERSELAELASNLL